MPNEDQAVVYVNLGNLLSANAESAAIAPSWRAHIETVPPLRDAWICAGFLKSPVLARRLGDAWAITATCSCGAQLIPPEKLAVQARA